MRWFGWLRREGRVAGDGEGGKIGSPVGVVFGRERVRGVPYNLPRDLEEMSRLDFQHYLFRFALQGNFAAPIHDPRSILDVGTGTGRWAREMAQMFPHARVIGLDVTSPPADVAAAEGRTPEPLPPNYMFQSGNVLEGLMVPDGSIDFTHMRMLVSAIPHDRWPFVVSELARVTSPGGWVESVEAILPMNGSPVAEQLMDWIRAISARRGVEIQDAMSVADLMRGVGLSNVGRREARIPCGAYGGRVGKLMVTDYFAGVRAIRGVVVAQGLATEEQFDWTLDQALRDLDSPQNQCYMPVYIATGQRM